MSKLPEQIRATEERFDAHRSQRRTRSKHVEALRQGRGGDWRQVDDPSRVLNRLIALGEREVASEAMASLTAPEAVVDRAPATAPDEASAILPGTPPRPARRRGAEAGVLERILGENDLLGIHFLLKGALVSRAVGRVVLRRRGRVVGFGTGFMVSPETLLTNNHVLSDAATAANASVQFNFFEAAPGRSTLALEFGLRPNRIFLTDAGLDYSLVAVEPRADGVEVASRGWLPLIADSGKAVVGERVNIIQHPQGEPQQVSVHQNRIIDVVGSFLHYSTDTNRGSSGSPVMNDQWEVAALHHSGVPQRDEAGRILLIDGSRWDGSDRDREKIAWSANEGVRISQVVSHLENRVAGHPELTRLLELSFEPCELDLENLRLEAILKEAQRLSLPTAAGPVRSGDGGATWVLPLTVRVDLPGALAADAGASDAGSPGADSGAADADAPPPPPGPASGTVDQDALRSSLGRLEEHRNEPYFDADADAADREGYYPEELVDPDSDLSTGERFQRLAQLCEENHENRLSYRSARLDHLYPWIDLRPDRNLKSLYSGLGFEPEEVIRLDLEIAAARAEILRERMAAEGFSDPDSVEQALDDLEAQMPFNCEHVVPQSWFSKAQPMKADLHHLFTCEPRCNSFRSNTPYFQFPEEDEAFQDACGRSEMNRSRFEPVAGKGPAARATLYFLLRYPGLIGDEMREHQAERLDVLLDWHRTFAVGEYERHRNAAIFAVQGNRNPLIDFPELAHHLDFPLGFGVLGG